MGLVIMKRGHLKAKTDFFKLRLLFQNRLSRRIVRELVERTVAGRLVAEAFLDAYSAGERMEGRGRVRQALMMRFLELAREGVAVPREKFRETLSHPNVRRTILNALLSLDTYGFRLPMRFHAPLMVVWNLTYRCNLRCRHCYENAGSLRPKGLSQDGGGHREQ